MKRIIKSIICSALITGMIFGSSVSAYAGPGFELTWGQDLANQAAQEEILNGSEIRILQSVDGGQILSSVIKTAEGYVIVVDGGRRQDAPHLIEVLHQMGISGVDAWLVTHPHDDHMGALTQILEDKYMRGIPVNLEIGKIYYHFLDSEYYRTHDTDSRFRDYQDFYNAIVYTPIDKVDCNVMKDQTINLGLTEIKVMNNPLECEKNTYNNSSVAFRVVLPNGKRVLYLGDMGSEAGENLLKFTSMSELKADIVQMAHHGQNGVDYDLYNIISPTVCMWPTPEWLWDNEKNGLKGEGNYLTLSVRNWMKKIGVTKNLVCGFGDQILR